MTSKLSIIAFTLGILCIVTATVAQELFPTDIQISFADDTLEEVSLDTNTITINGNPYSKIYISENGMVTTESSFYGGVSFPYTNVWIAPFGFDVIIGAGTLHYKKYSRADTTEMTSASSLVSEVYPGVTFTPTFALAVTWEGVITDNTGQTNTFQLVLTSGGAALYAIFILKTVESLPVQIGASAGDGTTFYRPCYSDKLGHVPFLNRKSNAQCGGSKGVLVFRLDQSTWGQGTCTHLQTPIACRNSGPADANFTKRCPSV